MSEEVYTLQMHYQRINTVITCPTSFKYDDIIQIAMERFSIPVEFTKYIQIIGGPGYIFDKNTFEKYLELFPSPKMLFEIHVNYISVVDICRPSLRETKCKKRQGTDISDEYPAAKRRCFLRPMPLCDVNQRAQK